MKFSDLAGIAAAAGPFLTKAMEVAEVLAPLVPGGTPIVSIIKMATTVGAGLAKAEPAAEALFAEMKAVKEGGAAPTEQQWADWESRVTSAHDDLDAALKG